MPGASVPGGLCTGRSFCLDAFAGLEGLPLSGCRDPLPERPLPPPGLALTPGGSVLENLPAWGVLSVAASWPAGCCLSGGVSALAPSESVLVGVEPLAATTTPRSDTSCMFEGPPSTLSLDEPREGLTGLPESWYSWLHYSGEGHGSLSPRAQVDGAGSRRARTGSARGLCGMGMSHPSIGA